MQIRNYCYCVNSYALIEAAKVYRRAAGLIGGLHLISLATEVAYVLNSKCISMLESPSSLCYTYGTVQDPFPCGFPPKVKLNFSLCLNT